jgi:hypothetical protein
MNTFGENKVFHVVVEVIVIVVVVVVVHFSDTFLF